MRDGSISSLLPILRSRQQGEVLALVLGNPDDEFWAPDLARQLGIPYSSVHRELERARQAGIVRERTVGRTILVKANTDSPYFDGLADIVVRGFGPPTVIADALRGIEGIERAFIFGSWAARFEGVSGPRPVNDIDVLVLGSPDLDTLYAATYPTRDRLGRAVNVTVRAADWLERGCGSFHDTVVGRPMVELELRTTEPT